MFNSIKSFESEFKYESEATLKLLQNLTDESLNKQIHPGVRTAGFLAWHIVVSVSEMMNTAGVDVDTPPDHHNNPNTVKEMTNWYKRSCASLTEKLPQHWSDKDLDTKVPMYGEEWKKGSVLSVLIKHQAHHRGQLTILMRMLNLPILGMYGPTKEEWVQMGMPALK